MDLMFILLFYFILMQRAMQVSEVFSSRKHVSQTTC